jgi:SAM-dependent methyltransferase
MQTHRSQANRDAVGAIFAEADVARSYAARPPYAPALYDCLLRQVAGRGRALDLGCGPVTVAIALADHFAEVIALDPSAAMLAAGRAADAGRHPNLRWVEGRAELFEDAGRFDLVTAGTSIHWPDHAALFPKLADWTGALAVIANADLALPCGEAAGRELLQRWLAIMAERTPGVRRPYDPAGFAAEADRHEVWMDIAGRERFAHTHRQSLADYIDGQHSSATWSRAAMGAALSAEFDRQWTALLAPFAPDGWLELRYVSTLTWGAPRRTPASP